MVAVGGILATRFNTPLVVPFICGCWSCSDPPHPEWAGSCPTIGFFTWAALVGWERVGLTQKPLQSEATRCCCCCCCCYCCCCCCCNFAFDMPVVIQKAILFPFFFSPTFPTKVDAHQTKRIELISFIYLVFSLIFWSCTILWESSTLKLSNSKLIFIGFSETFS